MSPAPHRGELHSHEGRNFTVHTLTWAVAGPPCSPAYFCSKCNGVSFSCHLTDFWRFSRLHAHAHKDSDPTESCAKSTVICVAFTCFLARGGRRTKWGRHLACGVFRMPWPDEALSLAAGNRPSLSPILGLRLAPAGCCGLKIFPREGMGWLSFP